MLTKYNYKYYVVYELNVLIYLFIPLFENACFKKNNTLF